MPKKLPLILISISLILFFIIPTHIFAQETQDSYWPLEEKRVENLLNIIRSGPLTDANRDLFNESIRGYDPDSPRKTGAVVLVKQAILKEQLDYWFKEVPKQLSIEFLKVALKLVRIVYAKDIGTIIEIIEQVTVQEATDYAVNWFVQNDIKIGAGEANYIFNSYLGNPQKLNIQYVIVYYPLSKTRGKIAVEFYSKNPIEPPIGTGPDALARPMDDPKTTCWPWDRWIENERKRDNDGKLEPFIVRVKGFVKRDELGVFSWDDTKESPIVEVDFDNPVPEIEVPAEFLEEPSTLIKVKRIIEIIEKELARMQEKLVTPKIKRRTKDAWEIGKDFFQGIGEGLTETAGNLIDKLGKYLSGVEPEAQIGQQTEFPSPLPEPDWEKLTEEALSLEEIIAQPEESLSESDSDKPSGVSLEELVERFDEILERAEILLANAQEFLPSTEPEVLVGGLPEEKGITEGPEEEEEEEREEKEEKEMIEEVSSPQITFCSLLTSQSPARNKIIFNEIAWMGSINSSNDEWFELKNISGSSVDLTGWQILDKDAQIKIVFENSTLNSGGFLLLERTDDDSVPGISADLIYSGALSNTNEALYLFDENCNLQDKVETSSAWPAGDNSTKQTMERKANLEWQTSRYVGGTPKAENSSGEVISGGSGAPPPSPPSEPPEPMVCPQDNLSPLANPLVVINEVAWMGTTSSTDEWIELKNVTTSSVSLNEWQVIGINTETNKIKIEIFFDESDKIASFYLLERDIVSRSDDDPVPAITADKNFVGSINNEKFVLRLFNSQCQLIDEVKADPNWPAGDKDERRTMERDQDLVGWHTYYGEGENGIMGTPRKENSQPPENQLPIAEFIYWPENPQVEQEIIFDASSSTDPDGQIVSFVWNFGDGNSTTTNLATTTYSFSTPSEFQIILQVTDDNGATSSTSTTLQVSEKPQPQLAQNVIISEVYQVGKKEFIELYNPTSQTVSTTGWYLSYFSGNRDWIDPYLNKEFLATSTIASSSYNLIGFGDYSEGEGWPQPDWKPYQANLNDERGAIGIFSCNPKEATTSSQAMACKIDAVGWKPTQNATDTEVKEGGSAVAPEGDEKSLTRKTDENGNYLDSNNNYQDFEIAWPTPTNSQGQTGNVTPPGSVTDFKIAIGQTYDNFVTLTWTTSTDPDTPTSSISYILYWSKAGEITTTTLTATTTASTTATGTTLTLQNLYYDSTYWFGIRAFDGLHYSDVTTTDSLTIDPETPQWQMFGYNSQRTFRSPYAGPTASTTKWQYDAAEAGVSQFWTGPAIDQNGTIYIGVTDGLLALKENGTLKWHYSTTTGRVLQPPLIGRDGTVYIIILSNKILALSPAGKLKWQKEIDTSFSDGNPYRNVNLVMANNVLYYATLYPQGITTKSSLISINPDNGETNLIYSFDGTTPPSTPVIGKDGTIYISFDKTLFAFDPAEGPPKWHKIFELDEYCKGKYLNPFYTLSNDQDGTIYLTLKGTHLIGQFNDQCADTLYAIYPDSGEIKWEQNLGEGMPAMLVGKTAITCSQDDDLYSFNKEDGTPLFSTSTPGVTTLRLVDSTGNLYGSYGKYGQTWVFALNSQGEEIWRYYGGGNIYFSFPFALSEDGTLYAPTQDTLFAFGQ